MAFHLGFYRIELDSGCHYQLYLLICIGFEKNIMLWRSFFTIFIFMSFFYFSSAEGAELPAFPGAEGFGAVAIGGRGGQVIKVTNLNSSGPGSLQAACAAQGPRIVVFEVGGVIRGDIAINHPYITIAGQTAPSPGIIIEGRLLSRPESSSRLHDIIVRFIRIRPPPTTGYAGDAIQLPKTERVILDGSVPFGVGRGVGTRPPGP